MSTSKKRSIAVVSGSRAEYGILLSVMQAIQKHPSLRLLPICAGMHLSKRFGETARIYKRDGFKIAGKAFMTPTDDSSAAMAASVGRGILSFVQVFKRLQPDVILVLGDRTESLAAAIAAGYMNILIAHIHGGDSARAGLDENARHSITKFAHIHFPATRLSAQRIAKLGEESRQIFNVGSPAADHILHTPIPSRKNLEQTLQFTLPEQYALLVYHPLSTAPDKSRQDFEQILSALIRSKIPVVAISPNSDAGHSAIFKALRKSQQRMKIKVFVSLPRELYLGLLKHATFMIGNSSSGIIDAPFFKLPVVNVGERQEGRERAINVVDVQPRSSLVYGAIRRCLNKDFVRYLKRKCHSPYGAGGSGVKIARKLASLPLNSNWLRKKLTY